MKLALAIICSFLLAGTPFLQAQSPSPAGCAKSPVSVKCHCHHGCKMPCCAAKSESNSQPAPAAPAPATGQVQIELPPATQAIWVLPDTANSAFSSTPQISLLAQAGPLYARDCARLI